MGIFDSLYIGKSGLSAAQLQISVTGQNITNAQSEGYVRQRVRQAASTPVNSISPGSIGTGVSIETIERVHDEFTFTKLKNSYSSLQDTTYKKQVLEEVAQYFPDVSDLKSGKTNNGIFRDIQNYFSAWNDFSSNTDEAAQKTVLLDKAKILTSDLNSASKNIDKVIKSVNDQINLVVDEINSIAEQIANINKEIQKAESQSGVTANDLRDKRDALETTLSKIANVTTYKQDLTMNSRYDDATITDQGMKYNLSINGVTLIEGGNFHPIEIDADEAQNGFGTIYYRLNDETRINMSSKITSGKLGAMLDLRGRKVDGNGNMTDGILTSFKDTIDTFAKTLKIQTNSVYAQASQTQMNSDDLYFMRDNMTLQEFNSNIKNGNMKFNVYNKKGDLVASKTININPSTSLNDTKRGNSIVDDFNSDTDDNANNNLNDDVNDYFEAAYQYDPKTKKGHLSLSPKLNSGEYYLSVEDNGTNVAGVLGLSKFFTGNSAGNISISDELRDDNSLLTGGKTPVKGDNVVANAMVNLQNAEFSFISKYNGAQEATISGYYRYFTANIASETESNNSIHSTNKALNANIYSEFQSISGVNLDEELTNLIQYQSSYGASAKIVTTIDEMLDTLLGIKR